MLSHKIYCNTELVKKEISLGSIASKTGWKSSPVDPAADVYYYNISDAITNEKEALEAFNNVGICAVVAIAQVLPTSANDLVKHLVLILIPNDGQHYCDYFLVPRTMFGSKMKKADTNNALGSQTVEFLKVYSKVRIFLLKTAYFIASKNTDQNSNKKKWDENMQVVDSDHELSNGDDSDGQDDLISDEEDSEDEEKCEAATRGVSEDEQKQDSEDERVEKKSDQKKVAGGRSFLVPSGRTSSFTDNNLENYLGSRTKFVSPKYNTPVDKPQTSSPKDNPMSSRLVSNSETPVAKSDTAERKSKFHRTSDGDSKHGKAYFKSDSSSDKPIALNGLINGNGRISSNKKSKN